MKPWRPMHSEGHGAGGGAQFPLQCTNATAQHSQWRGMKGNLNSSCVRGRQEGDMRAGQVPLAPPLVLAAGWAHLGEGGDGGVVDKVQFPRRDVVVDVLSGGGAREGSACSVTASRASTTQGPHSSKVNATRPSPPTHLGIVVVGQKVGGHIHLREKVGRAGQPRINRRRVAVHRAACPPPCSPHPAAAAPRAAHLFNRVHVAAQIGIGDDLRVAGAQGGSRSGV